MTTLTITRAVPFARLRAELAARREARSFERALGRSASTSETGDLYALRRRS